MHYTILLFLCCPTLRTFIEKLQVGFCQLLVLLLLLHIIGVLLLPRIALDKTLKHRLPLLT